MGSDLDVAVRAAAAGARYVRSVFGTIDTFDAKSSAVDPVTEADKAAERAILDVIESERPDDLVLSEESGGAAWRNGRVWIVDPIDGTVNLLHGVPQVAVSVALWADGAPRAGVVIDVTRGEVFSAASGCGAFLDGKRLSVSGCDQLIQALVATGFPYDRHTNAASYATLLGRVLERAQGIRRAGSAALDMCWVGAGRYDAYWEHGIQAWDGAASLLIVEEAGGTVSDFAGRHYELGVGGVLVSNGKVHGELVNVLTGV